MSKSSSKIASFTVFEATVVVAIIGILLTIVSTSINRFNEQLKNRSLIAERMNAMLMLRSTLHTQYYDADSLNCSPGNLVLYKNADSVVYRSIDGQLSIQKGSRQDLFDLEVHNLDKEQIEEQSFITLELNWTPENVKIRLPERAFPVQRINPFFKKAND